MSHNNPYYNPEKFDFEIIDSLEHSSGSYEFDTHMVFRNKTTGVLYWAWDAGCSCPIPFDDAEIQELVDMKIFKDMIMNHSHSHASLSEKLSFLEKVAKAEKK